MRSVDSALAAIKTKLDVTLDHGPRGVELMGREQRTPRMLTGRQAALVGFPAAGIGLAALASAAGLFPYELADGGQAPTWVLASIGAFFTLVGTLAFVHVLLRRRRDARTRRLRAAHPGEPWRWDHAWDERSASDDTGRRARRLLVNGLFLAVVLVPVHWIGFLAFDRPLELRVFALLSDVAVLTLLGRAGYLLARRLRYGCGSARFDRFPFRAGSTLELYVEAPPTLPQHALATATLRCIQERYLDGLGGKSGSTGAWCFEIYRDQAPAELVGGAVRTLRVRFDLPRDIPVTELSSRPCRYWEVEVQASVDVVDYAARFLVPVY